MEIVKMGDFTLEKILGPAEYGDKLGLYARVVVPPKAAVPYHQHVGDSESYYILSGEGEYNDNGEVRTVKAGDSTWTPDGSSHGLVNTGDGDLTFMALIVKN
jgi:quercetin dioxygenase-like cupin family protein